MDDCVAVVEPVPESEPVFEELAPVVTDAVGVHEADPERLTVELGVIDDVPVTELVGVLVGVSLLVALGETLGLSEILGVTLALAPRVTDGVAVFESDALRVDEDDDVDDDVPVPEVDSDPVPVWVGVGGGVADAVNVSEDVGDDVDDGVGEGVCDGLVVLEVETDDDDESDCVDVSEPDAVPVGVLLTDAELVTLGVELSVSLGVAVLEVVAVAEQVGEADGVAIGVAVIDSVGEGVAVIVGDGLVENEPLSLPVEDTERVLDEDGELDAVSVVVWEGVRVMEEDSDGTADDVHVIMADAEAFELAIVLADGDATEVGVKHVGLDNPEVTQPGQGQIVGIVDETGQKKPIGHSVQV